MTKERDKLQAELDAINKNAELFEESIRHPFKVREDALREELAEVKRGFKVITEARDKWMQSFDRERARSQKLVQALTELSQMKGFSEIMRLHAETTVQAYHAERSDKGEK